MKTCLNCGDHFQSDSWECQRCGWQANSKDGFVSFVGQGEHFDNGFNVDYFSRLYRIEKKHFWFRARNRLITWALKQYFPTAKTFLEVGCGTGFVLQSIQKIMPQLQVFGSELFAEGLLFAKKRVPGSMLFQMNAERIPFSQEFDVIGAFDVLEHITNDQHVLSEFHTALKKNGGIILTVPQHPFLWSSFDVESCHVRRYTRKDVLDKLSIAGFRTVFASSFVTFLLPVMMASRWMSKLNTSEQGKSNSVKIPGPLNSLFELVLTFELVLIRFGISLPFGGSLLVIARKK